MKKILVMAVAMVIATSYDAMASSRSYARLSEDGLHIIGSYDVPSRSVIGNRVVAPVDPESLWEATVHSGREEGMIVDLEGAHEEQQPEPDDSDSEEEAPAVRPSSDEDIVANRLAGAPAVRPSPEDESENEAADSVEAPVAHSTSANEAADLVGAPVAHSIRDPFSEELVRREEPSDDSDSSSEW
jgi:hypothetical protein